MLLPLLQVPRIPRSSVRSLWCPARRVAIQFGHDRNELFSALTCADAGRPFFARPPSAGAHQLRTSEPLRISLTSNRTARRRARRHLAADRYLSAPSSSPVRLITYANGSTRNQLILMQRNAIISREPISGGGSVGRNRRATSLGSGWTAITLTEIEQVDSFGPVRSDCPLKRTELCSPVRADRCSGEQIACPLRLRLSRGRCRTDAAIVFARPSRRPCRLQ